MQMKINYTLVKILINRLITRLSMCVRTGREGGGGGGGGNNRRRTRRNKITHNYLGRII